MEKKLHRIPEQAVFGGVAAGIAQYFQIDVVIIRVLMVVMLLLPIPPSFGWTGIIYVILWAVLPIGAAVNIPNSSSHFDEPKPFDPLADKKRSDQTVMILGGALVIFGGIMLIDDLPVWYQIKHYFWPLALIAVGAFLILRHRDKQQENAAADTRPASPVEPITPVNPDPQPYTPFNTGNPSATTWPEDPENKKTDEPGDDDGVIKVN